MDTAALDALWEQRWAGYSKAPYELRTIKDRWVRFHALPHAKRYPETEAEYRTVLSRHNTILAELVTGDALLVVTSGYSEQPVPRVPARSAPAVAVQPRATYWCSVCMDDEPGLEIYLHLYVDHVAWRPGRLDPLLRKVADDTVANVLLAPPDLSWLYHPYDGGMDVVLPTTAARDALRDRHRAWLSPTAFRG
ncbi:hypothetical protein WEI85_23095 [Actinomycetes bacterium KLBMP 9797]